MALVLTIELPTTASILTFEAVETDKDQKSYVL